MFNNLNWWNVAVLLLLALFIFGDKLPQVISDGLRFLRSLRRMARNATSDLSRELGTDIQLEDLHPKAFIRKHVLSEADQEALVKPLKGLSEDVAREMRGLEREFQGNGSAGDHANDGANGSVVYPETSGNPGLATTPDPSAPPTPRRSYDDMI